MRFVLSCAAARIKHRCGVGWSAEGGASLADASGYDKRVESRLIDRGLRALFVDQHGQAGQQHQRPD